MRCTSTCRTTSAGVRWQIWISSTPSSTLIHLATQGLDALDGYFAKFLPQMMIAVFVPAGVWLVITLTDWVSGVIVALTIPLVIIFMILIGITTRDQVNSRLEAQTRLANHFADLVTGHVDDDGLVDVLRALAPAR